MQQNTTSDLTRRLEELEREVVHLRTQKGSVLGDGPELQLNRRGFLTRAGVVAVGAGAASIASVLVASPAAAATGTMQYGATNVSGPSDTWLQSTNADTGMLVLNTGSGSGLRGQGGSGTGLEGLSTTGDGVVGMSQTGIGVSGRNTGVSGIGVKGETGGVGSGVYGLATTNGVAMYGEATATGTGVQAASANGVALNVIGKARFSRSGSVTIAGTAGAPKASTVVPSVSLTSKSLALVTVQKNVAGVWVRAAVPNVAGSSITIYLNKAATQSVPLAWMIIEAP